MKSRCLKLMALLSLPAFAAAAAEPADWTAVVPPGWEKATVAALEGTPDFSLRAQRADRYLESLGDFDGDGLTDSAALFINRTAGKHALFVTLKPASGARVYKVAEAPAALLPRMGLLRAAPGEYHNSCSTGAGAIADCTPGILWLKHDAIVYFTFESAQRYIFWTGSGFAEEWMGD